MVKLDLVQIEGSAMKSVGQALTRVFGQGLSSLKPWQRWLWLAICFAVGLLMVYLLPVSVFPLQHHLEITATGQKNQLAQGSEVWLAAVQTGGINITPRLDKICHGDWSINDSLLVSSENQPSNLNCLVKTDGQIYLKFGTHPWSGIVRITLNGQVIERDLFSATSGIEDVTLTVSMSKIQTWFRFFLFLIDGLAIGLLLFAASIWFVTRPGRQPTRFIPKTLPWYVYSLPMTSVWLFYLFAFWPGFLSPDTVTQLREVVSGQFYNWHPAFHTMSLWLFTRPWFSPAAVAVLQILVLSGLLGWGLASIHRLGTRTWLVWLVAGFLALSPALGLMVLTLWKDVAYAIAVLALILIMLKVVASQGAWIERQEAWITLGGVASLICLYRHNGAPVAFGSLMLLWIGFRRQWKPVLAAATLTLILWLGLIGPFYKFIGVNTTDPKEGKNPAKEYFAISLALWHENAGNDMLPAEHDLLDQIILADLIEERVIVAENSANLTNLAFRLTRKDPITTLRFMLNRGTFVFQVLQPWQSRLEHVDTEIYENPFGFKPASKFPVLKVLLTKLADWTKSARWDWLFWRNAFWMYLLIFSTAVASLRQRSWKNFIIIAPVLLNALPLAILSAGQLARYILPTLLAGPLLCAYFLSVDKNSAAPSIWYDNPRL